MVTNGIPKIEVGDLFSFSIGAKEIFLQFLGFHDECQCVLRLTYGARCSEPSTIGEILFYPLALNVKNKSVSFVRHQKLLRDLPSIVRRPGTMVKGVVEFWYIDFPDRTIRVSELSEEQTAYPVYAVMSHSVLVDWLTGNGFEFLFGKPLCIFVK